MAASFAIAADVASRWRPLSDAESHIADTLADDASDIIRSRFPDVDDRVAAGALTENSMRRIVAAMVKRAMLTGDAAGLESRSQAAGPFSVSDKFSNPSANLYLNADELLLLEGPKVRSRTAWLA